MDFDPLLGIDEDYLLERECRLSRSVLWALQRRYFIDTPASFSSGALPMYATTNAFIARAYARLIAAFARDCGEPVTVLELGAGHGRFGFLCLSALLEQCRESGELPPVRYVLSDFTEHSLKRWASHPQLSALIDSGLLDIARFDAEKDASLTLRCSGETISPSRRCGPMVVIANYIFDGLIQDAFRVRSRVLEEGRISLMADHPWPSVKTPGLLAKLTAMFTFSALPEGAVYTDPALNHILTHYRDHLTDSAFGLPIGAVQCVNALREVCQGPMVVLSSDKGHNHLHQLQGLSAPYVSSHGSVSMMANHDALGRYVTAGGGQALLTSARSGELETAAFVIGSAAGAGLTRAFADAIEDFSPSDYLELFKGSAPTSVAVCLKLLKLSGWDPGWLCQLIPVLLAGQDTTTPTQRIELIAGIGQANAQVFSVGEEDQRGVLAGLRAAVG